MPDYPTAALRAASEAIERELMSGTVYGGHVESEDALAKAALDAAAPVLAEAVAQRILAFADERSPMTGRVPSTSRRTFATAARVAAGTFTTEAELRQQVAEALVQAHAAAEGAQRAALDEAEGSGA